MCKIVIQNLGNKSLIVRPGSKSLLHHVLSASIDWLHSCGGKGNCTTCKAVVVHEAANLGPLTAVEQQYRQRGWLSDQERLACQAVVNGDVVVRVPEDTKLGHVLYTD
ncbi:MAG: (2Fe-2S)-binding protein [Bacteroidia bacterium]|nr:(2Fe-2S)-binding protein [Bacteroidia bacterium]